MMGKATFDTADGFSRRSDSEVRLLFPEPRSGEHGEREARPSPVSVSWSLVEPGLQDLSQDCRQYIRYFDLELSKECVVYNNPSANPFLALMPLMPGSHALSHIMVSISAFHFTHRIVINHIQAPSGSRRFPTQVSEDWYSPEDHAWQKNQPNYGNSLSTALSHKQKALECLKHELQVHPERNNDAVIAAVILFICLDVVEFGGRGWKHHLRGAEEMIRSRKSASRGDLDSARWLTYFDTACTTFGIMGATLAPAHLSSRPPSCLDPSFLQTLRHSEHQTWVGCPAELLYLLSVIDSIRSVHHSVPEREDTIASLCSCLGTFSPSTWAKDFPDQQHYQSRYHLACTYKAAIEVYASHIIGPSSEDQYLSESYILDTTQRGIAHMLSIPPHDFHIKSLVWPAFVLGAETERPDLRQAVRATFRHIWVSSCCYNARNAARMLDKIWAWGGDGSGDKSWLEFVQEKEESWLFL
ncbi:hypothetical protein NCS57_01412300 [Fusarium keratoplasticum]|uniref:Uncharacterized protein n=1 Tax=Fusarium keratoplasticum TaxID=1328300 RepID=A0ACC0QGS5_9HYPO|nr:hypothetical protein NCS57_01412300 [Fusarium keratoplasticum]KAI8650774.1 hypothetical protein NCS57_01412300 [Fusarium keratoplasticum]